MFWQEYVDMRSPKAEADVPVSCAVCCTTVPAGEMWGVGDADHQKGGWMVCKRCHSRYEHDPWMAWQVAEDRWESDGPCAELKEAVLSGR